MIKKTTRSFPKVIRRYILATLSLFLLAYTFLLHAYMGNALWLAASYELDIFGRQYERMLEEDPNTPLPQFINIKAYDSYDAMPEEVRAEFPEEELTEGELLDVDVDEETPDGDIEEGGLLIFPYEMKDGKVIYFVQTFHPGDYNSEFIDEFDAMSTFALIMALGVLVLFLLVLWVLGRRLTAPAEKLADWAQGLSSSDLRQPVPNFSFRELNNVAEELHTALVRIDSLVEREREFLQQASHELRTPITVICGNIELLARHDLTDKQQMVIQRIGRAAKTMTQLTETLLWLGREIDPAQDGVSENTDLVALAQRCKEELQHLSEADGVECRVNVETQSPIVQAPVMPLYIVVTNLLRNAFQHTPQGRADVWVKDNQIVVENHIDVTRVADGKPQGSKATSGYGIGLKLVEKICLRCGWGFTSIRLESGGFRVTVDLGPAEKMAESEKA